MCVCVCVCVCVGMCVCVILIYAFSDKRGQIVVQLHSCRFLYQVDVISRSFPDSFSLCSVIQHIIKISERKKVKCQDTSNKKSHHLQVLTIRERHHMKFRAAPSLLLQLSIIRNYHQYTLWTAITQPLLKTVDTADSLWRSCSLLFLVCALFFCPLLLQKS